MTERLETIPLTLIDPNPDQPRRLFAPKALDELAESIKLNGVLEPIVVTPRGARYFLIAGERRWRASQLAERETIPAIVREATNDLVAELALLENINREDLTPLEEANAYQGFLNRGYTVEGLAKILGFRQSWRVAERLRLLHLRSHYQDALAKGILSPLQASYMAKLDAQDQDTVFRAVRDGKIKDEHSLRALVATLEDAKAQPGMFAMASPSASQQRIHDKYTRLLDRITTLLRGSFDAEDLSVLKRALAGNVQGNIERLDLIIADLHRIRKAMLGQAATQMVLSAAPGGKEA